MNRLLEILLLGFSVGVMAGAQAPEGEFQNSACLECHQQQDAELIAAWRDSVPASPPCEPSTAADIGRGAMNASALVCAG